MSRAARELTSEELTAAINSLAQDVVWASIHWRMRQDLAQGLQEWPLAAQEANTFWSLTFQAHTSTAVSALCRVYDQEKSSLHLSSLLQLVQSNLKLFETQEFLRRLKDNPFAASLAESARQPDAKQLEADIAACSDTDPNVKKLIKLRGAGVAHRSLKVSVMSRPIDGMTAEEIDELLQRSQEILNKYSALFKAVTYSVEIVGRDDFLRVVKLLHETLEKNTRRITGRLADTTKGAKL